MPSARAGDPGSPWAIGGPDGGHDALHPELGTEADFDAMVAAAAEAGIELALDFAIQCSPDHPWLVSTPTGSSGGRTARSSSRRTRPSATRTSTTSTGTPTIGRALWQALLDIVLDWCGRGIRVFRVDNPHTKPMPFWEWLIAEVRAVYPETIFLSEAFTRPAPMTTLAKLGFGQSYTYFTWKNTKAELVELVEQMRSWSAFYRPNMWPNTPDILHAYLQEGGRPAFEARLVLAATLSPSYGIYSGYEACENGAAAAGQRGVPRLGEVRGQAADAEGPAAAADPPSQRDPPAHPALQRFESPHWLETQNDDLIAFAKREGDDVVIVVVNLDPGAAQGRALHRARLARAADAFSGRRPADRCDVPAGGPAATT